MSTTMIAAASAAEQGMLSGEEMYRLGLESSVESDSGGIDLIAAHKWFNLAAMLGNAEARAYRAELAREMSPDDVAEAQRLAREFLASHRPRMAG
jgi:TPR repeat protein